MNNFSPDSSGPRVNENSRSDKLQSRILLKESIRKALAEGLINDETMAYIRALGYARQHNPNDLRIHAAIRETLSAIQTIYGTLESWRSFNEEEKLYNQKLAREKLGEGLPENFGAGNDERLAVTVPSRIVRYLEEQRILLIPVEIRASTIVEAGTSRDFKYRLRDENRSRQMYALNDHWIGLYFRTDPKMVAKGERGKGKFFSPAHPVTLDNSSFIFADTNLRGSNIDLFYPGLVSHLNAECNKGCGKILYLNLVFKNCWVQNMNLQFWRYVSNFPGTITLTFEDCDDFDEAYFPYLKQERNGVRYYLDLEKFAELVGDFASKSFLQYIENILQFSAPYEFEYLR